MLCKQKTPCATHPLVGDTDADPRLAELRQVAVAPRTPHGRRERHLFVDADRLGALAAGIAAGSERSKTMAFRGQLRMMCVCVCGGFCLAVPEKRRTETLIWGQTHMVRSLSRPVLQSNLHEGALDAKYNIVIVLALHSASLPTEIPAEAKQTTRVLQCLAKGYCWRSLMPS